MLDDIGISALGGTMWFGCFIKVFPYEWDPDTFQLRVPISKWHMPLFNLHRCYMFILWIVVTARFALNSKSLDVPPQIRVLQIVWILGYTLTNICFVQYQFKYKEILNFANSLFTHVVASNAERKIAGWVQPAAQNGKNSNVTGYVLMSTFLLFLNPPVHAAAVVHTPCAPSFVSSFIFSCTHTLENTEPFYEKIPLIIAENFVITNFLFAWSFNWLLIFLGLAWIRHDVRNLSWRRTDLYEIEEHGEEGIEELNSLVGKYRRMQCRMNSINEAFRYFLIGFPSILLGIVALLVYGTIRLWHIPLLTYVNFPTCGLRCLFESLTPLYISGDINNESAEFLENWKTEALSLNGRMRGEKGSLLAQKSCGTLKCTAGSMYTFEKGIFLITITNCAQLTLNLLLVWK